jgi:hypothetical protein
VLVGPVLGLFTDAQSILHVSELGVVMFLFVIGGRRRIGSDRRAMLAESDPLDVRHIRVVASRRESPGDRASALGHGSLPQTAISALIAG